LGTVTNGFRRVLDVLVACLVLSLGSPVLVATAVVVRLRLGAPVLFRQQRLGRAGQPFHLVKFRSMRHPAPGREAPEFDAERLTRLGQFLRSTSLDELPEMWNLLKGDLTLVGPRPLPTSYWHRYRGDEYERFLVKPGITGLAQVSGRNAVDWDQRLALDVQYVRTRSLVGDLRILLRTVGVVLGRSGVDHGDGVTMHELPEGRPDV
jgi:lipopolysaccharide/colanic/teichoic acid biosynthesis glycosyltransferase